MTHEDAIRLLGLERADDPSGVRGAYDAKRNELAQRLAAAPTDGLRAKYENALGELVAAYELLSGEGKPAHRSSGGLSRTQMADLPGSAPSYTQLGEKRGGVQLGLQPGAVLADRYKIRRMLGQGGMGVVYEAFDQLKQENIAIKVLLPELLSSDKARERFLNEAKIACKLSHPNIVKVFDVGVSEPYYYLTMELLEGQTLRQQMEAQKLARTPFPIATILQYSQQLTAALQYAHRNIVHRDLKPENIWIEESGQLKLMDFGIARAFTNTELTKTGMALGTAYYMAPEQLTGAKTVDGRADQYSLGVVLYELLTGSIPQGAVQPPRAVRNDVPSGISAAVMKTLNPAPDGRFANLEGLDVALRSRSMSATVRWSLLGTAAAVVLAVALTAAWPKLVTLFPDSAARDQARVDAIRMQVEVAEMLKRVDVRQKELDDAARNAGTAAERVNDRFVSARSESERDALLRQLTDARAKARLASTVREISRTAVFRPDAIVEAKGQQALGEANLRDGMVVEAAAALRAARGIVEPMLDAANKIEPALLGRDASQALVNRARETMRSFGGDADVALQEHFKESKEAQRLLDAGEIVSAHAKFQALIASVKSATRQFLEQVSASYAVIAQRKMSADDLETAQAALERAKAAKKIQVEFQ